MKVLKIAFVVFVFAAFTVGCTHSLRVSPEGLTKSYSNKKALNAKEETIGIKKVKTNDMQLKSLYNSFISIFSSSYQGKVIKDYDESEGKKVDKILEVSLTGIDYNYNHLKSFFIQWPGFIIFMPAWNGLSYNLNTSGSFILSDGKDNKPLRTVDFKDTYTINYTSFGRGTVSELGGWLLWSVPSLIGAFVPSEWDEEMKSTATISVENQYFGRTLAARVIKELNDL